MFADPLLHTPSSEGDGINPNIDSGNGAGAKSCPTDCDDDAGAPFFARNHSLVAFRCQNRNDF